MENWGGNWFAVWEGPLEVRRVRQGCKWRPEKLKGTLAGKKWFVPGPGVTEGEREGRGGEEGSEAVAWQVGH